MRQDNQIKCPHKNCPDAYHPANTIFCPETGKKMKNKLNLTNVLTAFTILLSIYSLLCTVYSDIIIQNNNIGFIYPFSLLGNQKLTVDFRSFLENRVIYENSNKGEKPSKLGKKLYIFVLDCSGSVQNRPISEKLKNKYITAFSMLDKNLNNKDININKNPKMIDVAKVQICNTLWTLEQKYEEKKDQIIPEFAIWSLEDKSYTIYPSNSCRAFFTEKDTRNSIREVLKITQSSKNTDFLNLFSRLQAQYKELRTEGNNAFIEPEVTLIIYSDLIQDVDHKYERKKEVEENWEQLEKKIQEISCVNIMANLIILDEVEPDIQKSIFPILKKNNIQWFRLNKSLIDSDKNNEDESKDIVYSTIASGVDIKLYYTNPIKIDNSSFIFSNMGKSEIKIDIPLELSNAIPSNFALHCVLFGSPGESQKNKKEEKLLYSGGPTFNLAPDMDDKLKFSYTGRFPTTVNSPMIRISIKDENKTYLIPIDFIKRLPLWAAIIMLLFYIALCLSVFCLFWIGYRYLMEKWEYRKQRLNKLTSK